MNSFPSTPIPSQIHDVPKGVDLLQQDMPREHAGHARVISSPRWLLLPRVVQLQLFVENASLRARLLWSRDGGGDGDDGDADEEGGADSDTSLAAPAAADFHEVRVGKLVAFHQRAPCIRSS